MLSGLEIVQGYFVFPLEKPARTPSVYLESSMGQIAAPQCYRSIIWYLGRNHGDILSLSLNKKPFLLSHYTRGVEPIYFNDLT